MNNIIQIENFKFNSMRKYMYPVYSELNKNCDSSNEAKKIILKKSIRYFFSRMRKFRNISLEDLTLKSKIPVETFIQFEEGNIEPTFHIKHTYNEACCSYHEFAYFEQKIREFLHPSIKESKDAIGKIALIKWGIKIPGFDLKNMHSPKGKLLEFNR